MTSLLERYELSRSAPVSVERFYLQAEIARVAYAERDAFVCDSDTGVTPAEHLVSPERAATLSRRISSESRLVDFSPLPFPEHKDTVFLVVVDRARTAVSFINSIFDDFGSGILAPKSGGLLHNRGMCFALELGHPNKLAGGKRPMHTILPAMLTHEDELGLSFGATGGHFQPIGQMQVLSNLVDYGMNVQEAIDAPRMFARGDVLDFGRHCSKLFRGGAACTWSPAHACAESVRNGSGDLD